MASNGGEIRFGIGFDLDQSSLSKIKSSLKEIQNLTTKDIQIIDPNKTQEDLNQIKKSATQLQTVLQKSFNTELGTLNVTKFNEALHKLDLNKIQRDLANAGTVGQKAFKDIATQALTTNMQLKQTNNIIDQMGTTMMNTIKWGISSSVMNSFTGSVQEAFGFVKSLDTSLTNIRIVTGQSRDEMAQFAVEANKAAAALGRQTKEYTQAALTFYQQGLDEEEVKSRTETTLKASNITGQSATQMADELTAVWNGFQVQVGQEADVVSKLAAVADSSASNMSELATAMSKVAAVANSMGVDVDQLAAQISTIISVTRGAPESVGNALKTIYARIADIKAGVDEEEVSLGNYSAKIASLGFNILDANGNLKNMGEFLEEVGEGWQYLTKEQQTYLARTMAGQRQYNNLVTLFDNWDKYIKNVNVSLNSQGALEEKNSRYMESLAAHIKEFESAKEGLMISATDTESFKNIVDVVTNLTKGLTSFIDAIGGGGNALMNFGAIATTVFSKQIGGAISDVIINFRNMQSNIAQVAAQQSLTNEFRMANQNNDANLQVILDMKQRILNLDGIITAEEQNAANELIKQVSALQDQETDWNENVKSATDFYNKLVDINNATIGSKDTNNIIAEELKNINPKGDEYKNIETFFAGINKRIEETKEKMPEYTKALNDAQKSTKKWYEMEALDTKTPGYDKANLKHSDDIRTLHSQVSDMQKTAKALRKEGLITQEQLSELTKKHREYLKSRRDKTKTELDDIKVAKEYGQIYGKVMNEVEQTTHTHFENIRKEVNGASTEAKERVEEVRQTFTQSLQSIEIKAMTTQVVKLVGSISSISMAFSNLARIPKIWDDDNLTKAEKLTQIIQTASFSIPMLATGFGQATDAIKNLGKVCLAAQQGIALAEVGTVSFGTALGGVLAVLGPIILAIGALGVATYAVYEYMTRFERAVDNADKALSRYNKQLADAQQQQSEFNNQIQHYEELSKKIKDITKYTDEWRQVNLELNQSITDLIAKFPELAKYVTTINGHIGLTEKGIEAAQKANEFAIQNATLGQFTAQKKLLQAQQKLSLNNTVNKIGSLDYNTNGTSALYNDIGAVNAKVHLNALDGEGNHVSVSIDEAKELQAALEALKDSNEEVWYNDVLLKETLIKNENISSQIADKLVEHKDALQQLQITTNNNLEALNNLNNTITETYLQRSDKFQGDENAIYRELIAQSTGQDQTNYVKDYWNLQAESNADTIGNFEDVIEDFLQTETGKQYAGIEYQLDKEHSQGWAFTAEQADKNTKYLFGDVSISIKEMKDAIQTAGQYNSAIEKAEKHHFDEAVKAFEKMDQNIAASLLHGLQEGSTLDYTQYTKEQQEAFEEGLYSGAFSDKKLQEYGINIAEGFEEGRKNQKIEDAKQKDIDTRATIFNQSKSLDELHLLSNIGQDKNTSTDQLQQIQNNLHQISLESEVADKSVLKIFDSFNLKGQKAVDISGVLANDINNLGTEGSFEKLSNDLKENGLAVNFMEQSWQQLIHESGAYIQFLEHLSDKVTGLNNIITETASGKKMSKSEFKQFNEDLQDTLNLLGDVSKLTPQLQQDIITIQDSFLQGTQQWNDALKRIREEAEIAKTSLDFSNMEQAFANLSKKVDERNNSSSSIKMKIDVDADNFNQQMQQLLDTDYTLELSVNADIESDLKDMGDMRDQISQLNALANKTSITFDDIRGIYSDLIAESEDAVTVLEDGSIQLSDTVIAEAKRRKEEELAAARETTQGEIQEQMNRIKAKIAVYEIELKAENEYIQALEHQKSAIESGNNTARNETAKIAAAKKKAYEEEVNNANKKVKAIDEAAGKEVEAVNNSSESQVVAMQGVVDADQKMINSAATTAEKVSKSVADMAKSTIANYDAMAAAKANAMAEHPQVSSGAQAVGAVTGSRGTVESIGALKTLDYQSVGESKIELEFSDSAAQELQNVENELAKTTESRNQTQNQLDRYKGQLEALTGQLADLNSGNYANNAGERPKAEKAGKGGGKGKSAKEKTEKEPDKMDPFEDSDLDGIAGKFRDIDAEIQKLTRDLEKLQKLQSRYLGSALVHNLNEQLKIAKKQKAAYGEKLKIAKEELESQKAKLQAQGIEIGKNGTIKNYTETLKQKQKEINDLVDKHNAATKEGQKDLKEQVETQKKSYNELKNQMNAYEQLNGQTLPEIEAKIAEIEEMIINLQIEKFNARIELHLDWQSFLDEYRDFQSEMKEFFNSRATMFVDLETGEISGKNDNYENALAAGRAKAENARLARQQADAAEKAFNSEMKKSKKKKNRESLAEQYEIETEGKSKKQIKQEIQKAIADAYEARNDAIKEQKEKADAEVDKLYQSGFNIITEEQAEAAEEYRKSIEEINKIALEERKVVDEEFSQYKKPSNDIIDEYNETLKEIEEARKESLDEAAAQYNEAVSNIADSSKVKIIDVFKTYTSKMDDLAKASDQMINGTILSNGQRGKSVIEENMEHALDLADRIDRMNKSTKLDKEGNKIMGTDDLKVGSTNPLTGERITNKKELKQVKKKIGKDKSGQVYADMQKKIYEDGKKYAQSLEEQIKTLQDQIQQAWENYYAAIDKVLDYTKQIIDDYEYIDDMYELQLKYLDLIGEKNSENAKIIREQQAANQKAQNEYYEEQIKFVQQKLIEARDTKEGVESEEYKKYYEQLTSLSKEYYELRLKQIENLKNEALNAVDDIIDKLDRDVTNGLGIEETIHRWNDTKTEADSYLNSLEKVNAVQSLKAKYQEAIDSTDDIKQQEKLKELMDQQVESLSKAEYLSQAEVTHAEDLLDVTKKQMALEEAKQNKSKMRLRRDSQGNYTYQFVADENNIKNKQQELQESLVKMNDDTTKALRENYDNQTQLFRDYISDLKEIEKEYIESSAGLTGKELEAKKAERDEKIDYRTSQYQKQASIYDKQGDRLTNLSKNDAFLTLIGAAQNSEDLQQFFKDMNLSSEDQQAVKEVLEQFVDTDLSDILGQDVMSIIKENNKNAYDTINKITGTKEVVGAIKGDLITDHKNRDIQINNAVTNLKNKTDDEMKKIETENKQLHNDLLGTNGVVRQVIGAVEINKKALEAVQGNGKTTLDQLYNQARKLENENLTAIGAIKTVLEQLVKDLQDMAEEEKNANMTKGDIVVGNKEGENPQYQTYTSKAEKLGTIYDSEFKILGFKTAQGKNLVHVKDLKTGYKHWIERKDLQIKEFDTGGYTGEWSNNSNGKLAVLHEKELVLNQTDTSNLLDAVQITRSIANAISGLGLGAVSNLSAAVSSVLGGLTGSSSTVDQNVTISANFPNVSSHTEIETALMNLVNVASQKASPNRRTY